MISDRITASRYFALVGALGRPVGPRTAWSPQRLGRVDRLGGARGATGPGNTNGTRSPARTAKVASWAML